MQPTRIIIQLYRQFVKPVCKFIHYCFQFIHKLTFVPSETVFKRTVGTTVLADLLLLFVLQRKYYSRKIGIYRRGYHLIRRLRRHLPLEGKAHLEYRFIHRGKIHGVFCETNILIKTTFYNRGELSKQPSP